MLVSLDRWRSEEVGRQALRLLAEHTFRYGDQCALNVVAAQRWDALEPHWNLQSGHLPDDSLAWITEETEDLERARRNPTVIHYTYFFGQKKPWEADCSAVHRDAWFEALDRTAWAGWRPGETRPNPARVAARRVKRAGRVLVGGA
jgi:lipopolysaccharide biosynthesis glycosyltransferase